MLMMQIGRMTQHGYRRSTLARRVGSSKAGVVVAIVPARSRDTPTDCESCRRGSRVPYGTMPAILPDLVQLARVAPRPSAGDEARQPYH